MINYDEEVQEIQGCLAMITQSCKIFIYAKQVNSIPFSANAPLFFFCFNRKS